ncbi:hypothetical protein WICPIJ_001048 [Wickerhamomyces pijperi]|uniref:Uncharacterized protein n=1 Tax=Wickerhamomyces pijperi TaxID=599730 RepID=A0A9P8QCJ3_WICPI|nr:hypothetical protein WICPIJ_001048 [Wickerhamomyces pijperi]
MAKDNKAEGKDIIETQPVCKPNWKLEISTTEPIKSPAMMARGVICLIAGLSCHGIDLQSESSSCFRSCVWVGMMWSSL